MSRRKQRAIGKIVSDLRILRTGLLSAGFATINGQGKDVVHIGKVLILQRYKCYTCAKTVSELERCLVHFLMFIYA